MIGSRYSAGRFFMTSVQAIVLALLTAPLLVAASPQQAEGAAKFRIEILEEEDIQISVETSGSPQVVVYAARA